jgi:predicted amidohydrolase
MSSVDQSLRGFADLFCELYDDIDSTVFRANIESWLADTDLLSVTTTVAGDVEHARSVPERIRMRVSNTTDPERQRFACLRGLDRAFAHVNPALRGTEPVPAGLAELALHTVAYQRLDSGHNGGALLPRLVTAATPRALPEHPRELFASVIRVPEPSWRMCDHQVLGEAATLHRHEILTGLPVACVPFIADPDELAFDTETREAGRFYRISPRELTTTRKRIATVVEMLDRSGAMIALAPELTLTPILLEAWQQALKDRSRGQSRLHWLLAGSGDLSGARPPKNTAVLLNGRTGEILASQDKMYPFNFGAGELVRWKLTDRLGDSQIDEDLKPGERLAILDAGPMRVAVMVCEDLGRVLDLGSVVRDFGVSHVLVPVFARPSQDRRWERAAANVHAQSTGSTIIVANSLVMASILGDDASSDGTGLVVWPGAGDALVLRAGEPQAPASFRLLPDGSATAT